MRSESHDRRGIQGTDCSRTTDARPPDALPKQWTTGTQNHKCIVATQAAIDYLADLGRVVAGREALPRRAALKQVMDRLATAGGSLIRSSNATLLAFFIVVS